MLDVRRTDVLRYLHSIDQDFRTDASNADCRMTRNRLRNELLPAIRTYINSDIDQAFLRLAQQAGETQQLVAETASRLATACGVSISESPQTVVRIDCRPLVGQPNLIVREVCKLAWRGAGWPLQAMGFEVWQQLAAAAIADGCVSTINRPASILARRDGPILVLTACKT
jgi:hypothetical protein